MPNDAVSELTCGASGALMRSSVRGGGGAVEGELEVSCRRENKNNKKRSR
jgi:hypothetical protein